MDALVLAPEVLWVDLIDGLEGLAQRGSITRGEFADMIEITTRLPITFVQLASIIADAASIAMDGVCEPKCAVYLALARRHSAKMLACDHEVLEAANKYGL